MSSSPFYSVIFLLLFCFVSPLSLSAQNREIGSLKKLIQAAQHDTIRVEAQCIQKSQLPTHLFISKALSRPKQS